MIVTLSPAKLMDFENESLIDKSTTPRFINQANDLMNILSSLSIGDIAELMEVNPKLALSAYQQIQGFAHLKTSPKQAAFAYNGIAYSGLDIQSFTEKEMDYAQQHLVILSGLYGALRPLDMIKPYRLEMQAKLQNDKGENLYHFWEHLLTNFLIERLEADDKIWVNLMSAEYTKAIDHKLFPKDIQIIIPIFKQQTAKGYKQVIVYTKKARGLIARYILKNKIENIEELKAFDEEGYSFSEVLSEGKEWVFIR